MSPDARQLLDVVLKLPPEARRQSLAAANSPQAAADQAFIEAISETGIEWSAP